MIGRPALCNTLSKCYIDSLYMAGCFIIHPLPVSCPRRLLLSMGTIDNKMPVCGYNEYILGMLHTTACCALRGTVQYNIVCNLQEEGRLDMQLSTQSCWVIIFFSY